ncbi:protein giant-lens-like [Limulus polyphemus]|uniref:Protein giant-lens-like n=1 Tax=Limulus polyphemus TaxID=6850 RepID=A0ABM1TLU6_LIMPO|nr:protein giant-lens-like [Limulus polyphemus]
MIWWESGLVHRDPISRMFIITLLTTYMFVISASKLPFNFRHGHKPPFPIFYQTGNSEDDLPECGQWSVCNRVDVYSVPWVERRCRCPGKKTCSMSLNDQDGHTVIAKTRQYKVHTTPYPLLCQRKEPCRLFSVRKRSEVEDVNTDTLCHCPHGHVCPHNHKDSSVILEPSHHRSRIRTYSGYCTSDVD